VDKEGLGAHKQALGATLRRLRTERKLSQSDLARATGISSSFLSLVEQGRSDITIGRLLSLARFYELELTDLLGDADSSQPDPIHLLRADPEHTMHSDAEGVDVFDLAGGSRWMLLPVLTVYQPGGASELNDLEEHETALFVLDGAFEVALGDGTPIRLGRGEGLIYRSLALRRVTNVSKHTSRMLAIGLRQHPSSP
jgi:transcriptional regulator with XRE-family HTH domain